MLVEEDKILIKEAKVEETSMEIVISTSCAARLGICEQMLV